MSALPALPPLTEAEYLAPALSLLFAQRDAWNRADLEGYLERCADDIVYRSIRGTVRGRDALRASMRAAYPDAAAMGSLSLSVVQVEPAPAAGVTELRATLCWEVAQAGGAVVGGFALVTLREQAGRWWLSEDSTLSVPRPEPRSARDGGEP